MLNLATNTFENFTDNLITVDFGGSNQNKKRDTSIYTSSGHLKSSAADPIRNKEDIAKMQQYFLDHKQYRNYTLFSLGIIFGLRAGDLLSLRMHHIFNPDGTFKTHCNVVESKTRKFNNPYLSEGIRNLLTEYLSKQTKDLGYDDPVFPSRQKNPDGTYRSIDITQLNKILKKAARECGINAHISSHSMRKTFVYQLLKQNPNDDNVKFAVQKMLNHSDFRTTLVYCGITQETMDQYRSKFEEIVNINK